MDFNLLSEGRDHHDDRHHIAFVDASHDSVQKVAAPRTVAASTGSGWYHDAAIETAQKRAIDARCNPYG